MTKRTDPDPNGSGSLTSRVTQWAYNSASELTSTTDPLGNLTQLAYDGLNRLIVRTEPDPDGSGPGAVPAMTFAYNAAGRLTSLTDPVGNMTRWAYDNLLRTTSAAPLTPGPSSRRGEGRTLVRSWVSDAVGNTT